MVTLVVLLVSISSFRFRLDNPILPHIPFFFKQVYPGVKQRGCAGDIFFVLKSDILHSLEITIGCIGILYSSSMGSSAPNCFTEDAQVIPLTDRYSYTYAICDVLMFSCLPFSLTGSIMNKAVEKELCLVTQPS